MYQNQMPNFETAYAGPVSEAPVDSRAAFIKNTYLHLAYAVMAFIGIEGLLLTVAPAELITETMLSSPFMWLAVLGVFMAVGWVARTWADNSESPAMQYAGLGLYVLAEAIIFVPILFIAQNFYEGVILQAAVITLATFGGLTVFALTTKADFSFLRGILVIGGFVALGLIVASLFLPISLGLVFSGAMILLACGYILYDTSNVMHKYRTDQHVAASLALFAALALLFWYVVRIVMIFASDD